MGASAVQLAGAAVPPAALVQPSARAHQAALGRTTPSAAAAVQRRACWKNRTTRASWRWRSQRRWALRPCLPGASMYPQASAVQLAGAAVPPAALVQPSARARHAALGRTTLSAAVVGLRELI